MSEDIDMKQVAKAVEGINKTWEAEKQARAELEAEVKSLGAARPETEAKLAKMEADMDRLSKVADEAVLAMKRQDRVVTGPDGKPVDLEAKAASFSRAVSAWQSRSTSIDVNGMKAYQDAFATYARKGLDGLDRDEVKALSVGGDATGGYVVNPDMSGRIVSKVFETSPMRAYASVQVISTDALEGLFDLDEASCGWVEETGSRTETDTPDLGKWRIPAHEMYANPRATQKVLDDAEIDIEGWLAGKVAEKFARTENAAFVSGTGVGQPRGFLTYSDGATLPGTIERVFTGASGAFAAAPSGGDVLIDALYGLKAQYRANATWFMNRATTKTVRKLKDSDGAYLWSPGIAAGQPASILGYPLAAFEDMPAVAAGSLSIAVGDMRAAYQIVDRVGIRTLRDPYSAKPFIQFYSTKRVGGDVVNFEALKLVSFSAS
jgi:HK97 family phage major capsid protein